MGDMMNKKGFTLVEALLVLAIIGVLLLTIIPGILAITKKNKEKTCINTRDNIISTAKMYVAENKYDVIECGDNIITLDELRDYGNLSDATIDEKFPSSITVTYDCSTKKFTYTYNVSCES